MIYQDRFYRDFSSTSRWKSFRVNVESTDLYIKAKNDFSAYVNTIVKQLRNEIKTHINKQHTFLASLVPVCRLKHVPPVIEKMYNASEASGVGPMAAVAGAVCESVGEALLKKSPEVIVENGGDIYIKVKKPVVVSVFAGESAFSGKIGFKIYPDDTPTGVCTSSGTVGHSLSFGKADAATVISNDVSLADAVATGTANRVHSPGDFDSAIAYAMGVKGVSGVMLIFKDQIAVKGHIELCSPTI
jgi:ApbE superfamily uncharacterized protein (UPF0280 family)